MGWVPALGVVRVWITATPAEPEVSGSCPRAGLEATRSVAGPTRSAILCRAAGTGKGTVALSTLDSLEPGWEEGAGEHQRHHLAP